MDKYLFFKINSIAEQNYWLDQVMIFFADWFGYFLILLLLVPLLATFFVRNRISSWLRFALLEFTYYKKMLIIAFGSAVLARFVFVSLIRYFYYVPRPFVALQNVHQLIFHETTSSFPSGHASFYFALATSVYLYNEKLGKVYLIGALLISLARIVVGVHWPLDVLSGAVLGLLTALLVRRACKNHSPF